MKRKSGQDRIITRVGLTRLRLGGAKNDQIAIAGVAAVANARRQ